MTYSRANPSPRYSELLALYKEMHEVGDPESGLAPEETFNGKSLVQHAQIIKNVIDRHRVDQNVPVTSVLDYGCGKAQAYEKLTVPQPEGSTIKGLKNFWGIGETALYDPAYEKFSSLPEGRFDGVISTDVLEHCPEEDIDWIVSEMFEFSRLFVYCTMALYPAGKNLPNGENAHVTLKSPGWWVDRFEAISKRHDGRGYFLAAMRTPQEIIFIEG